MKATTQKKDYFYNYILSKYLIPINDDHLYEFMDVINELNNFLIVNKKITYREYIDILKKYYANADYPGIFYDILDDPIPVKGFTFKCIEGYSNMKKENNRWTVDENSKFYTWELIPIKVA